MLVSRFDPSPIGGHAEMMCKRTYDCGQVASVMNSMSWKGTAVWREESEPFPIRKAAGPAVLVLNDEGGLLRAGPTFPQTLRVDVWFG
jgi:hypothetical protein